MAFVRSKFEPRPLDSEGAKDVSMQVLIGETEGAPNFIMRRFRVEAGGHSPRHSHDYEHVVYILAGMGTLFALNQEFELREGVSLIVNPNELHQFCADKGVTLEFICTIPIK